MLRPPLAAVTRLVLVSAFMMVLVAGCDDQVKRLKTAAGLRAQVESAMGRIESDRRVPGLRHRHVTVDAADSGYAIKIYDIRLGDAAMGFQSFSEMTFSLAQSDDTHFVAQDFEFIPPPVTDGPKAASQSLVEQLKRAVSTLQIAD